MVLGVGGKQRVAVLVKACVEPGAEGAVQAHRQALGKTDVALGSAAAQQRHQRVGHHLRWVARGAGGAVEGFVRRAVEGGAGGARAQPLHTHARARELAPQRLGETVQPGLAGLMDGSVSTLAPIFATAFATQDTWTTFLVGTAASVGAGISMGFTEAAHDDGVLSGRGSPWKRGLASGVMTTIGGMGHALPYLIPDFWTATIIAMIVVFVELWAIAWIQNKFMETPFVRAALQVVLGGALVFAAGALIGGG